MAREEIEKKIKVLKNQRFMLAMKDRWTRNDFNRDDEMSARIKELEGMLN